MEKQFLSVEYFMHRYPSIFSGMDMDGLNSSDAIPKLVKENVNYRENDHYVDAFCYLRVLKEPSVNDFSLVCLNITAQNCRSCYDHTSPLEHTMNNKILN